MKDLNICVRFSSYFFKKKKKSRCFVNSTRFVKGGLTTTLAVFAFSSQVYKKNNFTCILLPTSLSERILVLSFLQVEIIIFAEEAMALLMLIKKKLLHRLNAFFIKKTSISMFRETYNFNK